DRRFHVVTEMQRITKDDLLQQLVHDLWDSDSYTYRIFQNHRARILKKDLEFKYAFVKIDDGAT
ncbi:hypothetical protein AVEN_227259-1, partial [Araneus ventricosus]